MNEDHAQPDSAGQAKSPVRIYKVKIVDAAIAKWKAMPGNKNLALALARGCLCKHFNDILGLKPGARRTGTKRQD